MAGCARIWAALLVAVLACACGGGGGGSDTPGGPGDTSCPTPPSGTSMTASQEARGKSVVDLVNEERAQVQAPLVAWHGDMAQVAFDHAWDMDRRNYFAHLSPCGEGPADRLGAAGIAWTAVGENIALGPPLPDLVMALWMNSPGHRANILDSRYTRCSVGVHDTTLGTYWVMMLIAE